MINKDGSGEQLYDVERDPSESNNVAAKQAELVRRLSEAVRAWNKTLPH
ncbi:MAG: hypothetical protein J2P31_04965 [Blastocatellia bacterium]|nr:hypothetical protein [Blastocatellia bacterium]